MKGFTKTKIALATAGLLASGIATNVAALDGAYAAPEPDYTQNLLGLATAEVTNVNAFGVSTEITDVVIGRTTGFGLRITLTGAEFAAGANGTVGTGIDADADFGGVVNTAWTIGAQTYGTTTATITINPGTTPAGLPVGEILTFVAGDLDVDTVSASLGAGIPVTALIEFFDPVTAAVLLTTIETIYDTAEGTDVALTLGNAVKRIDVGGAVNGSKTDFSPDGTINNATPEDYFFAGTVVVGLNAAGTSSAGTAAAAWDNAGAFQYNVAADTVTITLTGDDFSAFANVWLEDSALTGPGTECTAGIPVGQDATVIDAAGTAMTAAIDAAATGETFNICLDVDVATVIEDQIINATAQVNLDPAATMAGLLINPTATMAAISPLVYNGDVIEVHFFNDNGNVGQESRLRISNKGTTSGLVRIVGIDDAGVTSAEATLTLNSEESVQVKTNDLILGTNGVTGGLGLPTQGKYRLTVTAEYDGLEVTNFVRNIDSGILTNFTPSTTAD